METWLSFFFKEANMAGWFKRKVNDLSKEAAQTASAEVKKEVRKSLIDFIPGLLGVGAMILGIFLFKEVDDDDDDEPVSNPISTVTKTTINNFFLGEVSEDILKKILEDD